MGQKEPPRLDSTICYGQELARKSHQDSAVRFVTAKPGPERATKTRQYDLLRPRVGQKEPPRLGSTICYGQTWARKSHQASAVRFVTAKSWPEKGSKTGQYDLLRPSWPERATKTQQNNLFWPRIWPERATETRQYDLLRPRVGQKEPPRLGSTICYGQTWARKSHQDSAVRFVTARTWAIKSHQDSAVRFVTAKSWPGKATKTRQYDLLRPRVGQKEPPRLGSTICYGQIWARKSHQDSAVRFATAKSWPERATKTRQYDLLRPNLGQKEPPRLGSTICYGPELARKSHRDSAVRFVTDKRGPERATKSWRYDSLRPRVGQKKAARPGSTICYGQVGQKELPRLSNTICFGQEFGQKEPPRLGSTICYGQELARKSHQDWAVRFVTAKREPERADLLGPRVGQKEPPRLGSMICYGQELARKRHQDSAVRFLTAKSWPERATETRQDDLLRPRVVQKEPPRLGFVTAKSWPERATRTRQDYLLRPNVGQKEPPRLGTTICYGQTWARKSHQDSAVRFVTAKYGPERATKTRQYDLLRPRVGQKKAPRLSSTIPYGQELARKSHRDSAVRFVTSKSCPERATKTRICYGQELARKSHQDSAGLLVTAKRGPERATKTWQYDLLRSNMGQKEPPRLGSTICYGQTWARKSHQDSAVRFVTAKHGPERATKTRQYDLLRPRVGQKEPPRLGSTICYGQTWARKSHQDSAVRFVTAKPGPERASKTRQYDLLRPRVGQKEPPRLGSTICYGQTWARKSHQALAVRFVTAKSWPEKGSKTGQYDLLRPRVGQKEPP